MASPVVRVMTNRGERMAPVNSPVAIILSPSLPRSRPADSASPDSHAPAPDPFDRQRPRGIFWRRLGRLCGCHARSAAYGRSHESSSSRSRAKRADVLHGGGGRYRNKRRDPLDLTFRKAENVVDTPVASKAQRHNHCMLAALTIAMMPTRSASGSLGQASTITRRLGSSPRLQSRSVPDSVPPVPGNAGFPLDFNACSCPVSPT